jgi:hypothetical protein
MSFQPSFAGTSGCKENMWGNGNAMDVLRRMKRGRYWTRVNYSMENPIKEPILEKLVQFLRIDVKMDGKSRPPLALNLISPASVISAIATSTKKISYYSSNSLVMELLINHT